MSNPNEARRIPANHAVNTSDGNLRQPLLNLSLVRVQMDSLQRFITESIHNDRLISTDEMNMVSSEIVSAIQRTIVNGTALLTYSQQHHAGVISESVNHTATTVSYLVNGKKSDKISEATDSMTTTSVTDPKIEAADEEIDGDDEDCEIIELDAVELLAEHVHFCEICGKGFKRDANLRMHMRAHGNQFKTIEALAKPEKPEIGRKVKKSRFSCPFQGCNRNKTHNKFKALKSIICVRNHFKRSHCPKLYSCNHCNKKSFSVLADLKSHLKHCGEVKWKCSCGTTFSRKDKLFGHMALFEGHMPAVGVDDDDNQKTVTVAPLEEAKLGECSGNYSNDGFFNGLLDGFGAMEGYSLQDTLASFPGFDAGNW